MPLNKPPPITTPVVAASPSAQDMAHATLRLTAASAIPALIIATIACAIVGMIGFIVVHAVQTHGLMPRPTTLEHYHCTGFSKPVQIAFRHGLEVMQLHTGGHVVKGKVLNGRIEWQVQASDTVLDGLTMPIEVVYDDAHSVRLLTNDQVLHTCDLARVH